MSNLTRRAIALSIAIILIIAVAVFLEMLSSGLFSADANRTPPPPAPLTADRMVGAPNAKTPVALVSYVSTGFEPRSLQVKTGDTVRFINNSHGPLQIAQDTPQRSAAACAPASLNTCQSLVPGDYIDVTFTEAGDWLFHVEGNPAMSGAVHVQ